MSITFDIPSTEILVTSGQTEATCQDIHDAARVFESSFAMMGLDWIVDASGKAIINPTDGVYSEILLTLRYPWTVRFEDENTAHCSVKGGTLLAFDAVGAPRPVSTNYGLTVYQSVSGTLITSAGDAAAIATAVWDSLLTGHTTPGTTGAALTDTLTKATLIEKIMRNKMVQTTDGSNNHIIYDDDNITPLLTFTVHDSGGLAPTLPTGVPASRTRGV